MTQLKQEAVIRCDFLQTEAKRKEQEIAKGENEKASSSKEK